MDVWKAKLILRTRKWTVILTALVACALIMLSDQNPEARYRSTAKLLFNTATVGMDVEGVAMPSSTGFLGDALILKELMLSQDFLEKHVIASAQLKMNWAMLRDQLDMKAMSGQGGANLMEITVDDADPKQSQVICQAVVDGFMQYVPELMAREEDGNRRFLEKLVGEAKGQLDEAEARVTNWQDQHGVFSANDIMQEQSQTRKNINEQRTTLNQRLASAQTRYNILSKWKPGDVLPLIVVQGTNHIAQLQQALGQESGKLRDLQGRLQPTEPAVVAQVQKVEALSKQLQAEITSVMESMKRDAQADLADAQSQLESLKSSLGHMQGSLTMGRENLDFEKKQRDIDLWSKNYEELIGTLYKVRIKEQAAARRGAITLLEAPEPGGRVSIVPKTFQKRLGIAIVVSLVLGIALALALEYLSQSMRLTTNVEEVLELPVLGTLPRLSKEAASNWRAAKQDLIAAGRSSNGKSSAPARAAK